MEENKKKQKKHARGQHQPFSDVQERLGERIEAYLKRGDLLVLVRSDRYELSLVKARLGYFLAHIRIQLVDDNAWLVLVQRVELNLALVGRLVGQLDFVERNGVFGPVGAEIRRIRMLVLAFELGRVGLRALLPLAVYILPLVGVYLLKVDDHLVDSRRL